MTAVVLTTLAGLAACLGGAIIVFFGVPSDAVLGHLLSFAAGIMLYVSYGDLLSHASGPPPEGIGFFWANVWMFGGMLFFALVTLVVPEPDLVEATAATAAAGPPARRARAANSSGNRHALGNNNDDDDDDNDEDYTTDDADADAHSDVNSDGDGDMDNDGVAAKPRSNIDHRRLMMTGLIAALGISLHNLPEGLVVYNATIGGVCDAEVPWEGNVMTYVSNWMSTCFGRGIVIFWAIALHNIPEGMAVASPIYSATGSRWQAMKWCILSSICEPFAAIMFGTFFNSFLTS